MTPGPVERLVEALLGTTAPVHSDVCTYRNGECICGGKRVREALAAVAGKRWGEVVEDAGYVDVVFDGPPSHESGRFVETPYSTRPKAFSASSIQWC